MSTSIRKRPNRVVLCSNVGVDYFLFLASCVSAATGEVTLVQAVEEGRYRYLAGRGAGARVWLRFLMYIVYPLRLIWAVLRARPSSTFVVTSNTFFAPALVALFGLTRKAKVIHLLYDLFPDALEVSGALRRGGLRARILGRVARVNFRRPAAVVFLGDRLRSHASGRWGAPRCSAVIDISTDTRLYSPVCPSLEARPIRIHYGGQLGAMHDLEALAAAAHAAATDDRIGSQVAFSFAISGSGANRFRTLVGGCGIEVGATIQASDWRALAATMHVGLVTLSAGGATVCLPSKTYAMMASGMAIIAICPKWSDLANLVIDNEAGWVIDNAPGSRPDDPTTFMVGGNSTREQQVAREFVAVIQRIHANPEELESKRRNAHRVAHGRFGVSAIEERWAQFLMEVEAQG